MIFEIDSMNFSERIINSDEESEQKLRYVQKLDFHFFNFHRTRKISRCQGFFSQ